MRTSKWIIRPLSLARKTFFSPYPRGANTACNLTQHYENHLKGLARFACQVSQKTAKQITVLVTVLSTSPADCGRDTVEEQFGSADFVLFLDHRSFVNVNVPTAAIFE